MTIERALELLPQMRDSEWITVVGQVTAIYTDEAKEAFNMAISALEQQEQVNTQSVNLTHTTYPNALESLKILESAKDENGCVPMSLVRLAFRNVLEQDRWIPVTEKLPESKPDDLEYPTVLVSFSNGEVCTACYYESTKEWGTGENYNRICYPIAWRPLPEPYTEEEV